MVAHRVAFQKHLGLEPGRTKQREATVEPEQTSPDYLDHGGCLPPPKRDTRPQRGQTERGDLEDQADSTTPGLLPPKRDRVQEVNGNFEDRTDATIPGMLPPIRLMRG